MMLAIAVNTRRMYERAGITDPRAEYVFDSEGMEVRGETGLFRLKWRHLTDYFEGKRLIVIRWNYTMMFIIPFDQLEAGAADELSELLSQSGLKRNFRSVSKKRNSSEN